jgi:diacylglycerol kinase family enzyme
VAEIVNRVPDGVPVTVLPLGTENLLAKYLGIGREVESVGETIAGGKIVRLDAGLAISRGASGASRSRLFVLMASCGLDADVIYRLEQNRRGHISHLTYVKPIVAAFRNYKYPPLRITVRSGGLGGVSSDHAVDQSFVARWMFLFNLPCYARGLAFTPRASGDDGHLDLCTFERGSFWSGMRYLAAVLRGKHDRLADCTLRRVIGLRVETGEDSHDEPVPFQLDGDFGGRLPLEISILPRRLTLIVPQAWGAPASA